MRTGPPRMVRADDDPASDASAEEAGVKGEVGAEDDGAPSQLPSQEKQNGRKRRSLGLGFRPSLGPFGARFAQMKQKEAVNLSA